jgi:arsenate reductase
MNNTKKPRVIFLCTGNAARSQMAEALLRIYAGDQFDVHSAGLDPRGIHPLTTRVMEEVGLDLEGQHAKSLKKYLGNTHFSYLFTVCSNAEENCPQTFLSTGVHKHWGLEDPAAFEGTEEETLDKFREIRDEIDQRIQSWLAQIEG